MLCQVCLNDTAIQAGENDSLVINETSRESVHDVDDLVKDKVKTSLTDAATENKQQPALNLSSIKKFSPSSRRLEPLPPPNFEDDQPKVSQEKQPQNFNHQQNLFENLSSSPSIPVPNDDLVLDQVSGNDPSINSQNDDHTIELTAEDFSVGEDMVIIFDTPLRKRCECNAPKDFLRYSRLELQQASNIIVRHNKHGEIKWFNTVDFSGGYDFNAFVKFSPKAVEVYPVAAGYHPKCGEELNSRAVVTLKNVFKRDSNGDVIKDVATLKEYAEKVIQISLGIFIYLKFCFHLVHYQHLLLSYII